MTIWYSPTVNWASMVTPESSATAAFDGAIGGPAERRAMAISGTGMSGAQGSCSQYSTRRGEASLSILSRIAAGSVLTFSS